MISLWELKYNLKKNKLIGQRMIGAKKCERFILLNCINM